MLAEYFCVGNLREGLYKDIASWFLYGRISFYLPHLLNLIACSSTHSGVKHCGHFVNPHKL